MRPIKTYYLLTENENWGDVFTPFIFSQLYGIEIIHALPEDAELISCGSLIRDLPNGGWVGHILGSGLMDWTEEKPFDLTSANVHLLRGTLTRDHCALRQNPSLGDPGILAYLFAPPLTHEFELGIIPHYVEKDHRQVTFWQRKGAHVIDIQSGVQNVINEAARCDTIISSSLHGLVIADSLGIPNHLVVLHDSWIWGRCGFKFYDYYSVYGEVADDPRSIYEAQELCRTRDTSKVKAVVKQAFDDFVAFQSEETL